MTFSPDPERSPRRQELSSPPMNPSPAKGSIGLNSFTRATAVPLSPPPLAPASKPYSSDLYQIGAGRDLYRAQYQSRQQPPTSPYSTAGRPGTSPPINPGAKNSFASAAASASVFAPIGSPPPISASGRRKSSVQSSMTAATHTTTASMSTDSSRLSQATGSPEHDRKQRKRKGPSQRYVLSLALQKANDAVLLDNDSDLEGAIAAYQEACGLLKKVMTRSASDDDRKKLDAIRSTYRDRIAELKGSLAFSGDDSDELTDPQDGPDGYLQDDENDLLSDPSAGLYEPDLPDDGYSGAFQTTAATTTAASAAPPAYPKRNQSLASNLNGPDSHPSQTRNAWQQRPPQKLGPNVNLTLQPPPAFGDSAIPAPLSPWRIRTPGNPEKSEPHRQPSQLTNVSQPSSSERGHNRQDTAESTSWLDTIDESGDSTSSAPSRSSSVHDQGARRYLVRQSGNTIADFDAALDSAIEAAYDDGLEAATENDLLVYEDGRVEGFGPHPLPAAIEGHHPSDIRKKVKAAKERVRQAEREDAYVKEKIELRSGRATPAGRMTPAERQTPSQDVKELYERDELEQEEDILKEMQEYADDADTPPMPAGSIPQDSDTNSSRNAWTNSGGSTEASATTASTAPEVVKKQPPAISSLDDFKRPPSLSLSDPPVLAPKKPSPLNLPPLATTSSLASFAPSIASPGVRERRLSGRKIGVLTIDTGVKLDPKDQAPRTALGHPSRLSPIRQAELDAGPKSAVESDRSFAAQMDAATKNLVAPSTAEASAGLNSASPRTSLFARTPLSETRSAQPSVPASPARSRPGTASGLRKNFSSSSLKSLKNMVGTPTTAEDSPQTPVSRIFSGSSQPGQDSVPSVPELPTSAATSFLRHGLGKSSLSYFNVDIHSLASPGSPNPAIPNGPAPLEPCPESHLLRPFWLLRCIYQTIANPHGGYLSQKLFVPRDIWCVRNVKIKNVEEKVAQCDLLTAALLKLARSDMADADIVLEEMQSFELILDQIQTTLQKRLGAEVGSHGALQLFKTAMAAEDAAGSTTVSVTSSRISSGWRKLGLRSKSSSGTGASAGAGAHALGRDRDTLTMKSLPMATGVVAPKKHVRRDPTKVLGIGPHANYMAALARLSDAAQILDQVARQVEDPGLRHSSQTHVGLELCTRHAVDFFAFYICRFALNDIANMLDKFLKRGSEWILS